MVESSLPENPELYNFDPEEIRLKQDLKSAEDQLRIYQQRMLIYQRTEISPDSGILEAQSEAERDLEERRAALEKYYQEKNLAK